MNSFRISFDEAATVTSGQIIGNSAGMSICGISTDTRTIKQGDCYVALKGERLDGHDFLPEAMQKGASVAIVDRDDIAVGQLPKLVVKDTLQALGDLAQWWRKKHDVQVVVLTGSSGKTTTKEMAARIIDATRPTLVTTGNLNNLIGLPKMLFQLTSDHKAAVLELGMNTPGELKRLVEISDPQCVAVTNITNAHIGRFGSEDGLYNAKAESLKYSSDSATLILNSEDRLSQRLRDEHARGRNIISFGLGDKADVHAHDVQPLSPFGYKFKLHVEGEPKEWVELRVFGRHNTMNALAAAAIARYFQVPVKTTAAVLSNFQPTNNRSEVEQLDGWFVIKDYYNASPAAVEQALTSLPDFSVPGRRFAVLADMMELGDMEQQYHERIGEVAAAAKLEKLFTVGERATHISKKASGLGVKVEHLPDVEAVVERLRADLREGDLLLIKGSRLMKLERVYDLLKSSSS